MINPIALAIPVFLLMIGAEMAWSVWRGRSWYRINDTIADLSCGIGNQLANLGLKLFSVGIYVYIWDRFRLFDIDASAATWILAFIGIDLSYYLWHRFTHSVNIGWATHVVHHQSEDYNLAVALRQSMTSTLSSWPFYLPWAVLGVPPLVAITCQALNTLYQFWIHTEAIDKLGPLEWVMNTPSHHRVHHAIQPAYLDKNHAGVFIVWDRMFGTFAEERETPTYGTVSKLDGLGPLRANAWWFGRILAYARASPTWWQALAVPWRSPSHRPAALPPPPPREPAKYDPQGPPGSAAYALVQLGPVAALLTWVIWIPRPPAQLGLPVALILLGTLTLPALFERRWWFAPAELTRLVLTAALAVAWGGTATIITTLVFAGVSATWVLRMIRNSEPSAAAGV